ncbi:hypothetical protein CL656_02585 [bacterium]|nr:hypothetical protein [bacterium]|tara:strand:+ start:199 stop:870 length:672 start_codon:yes stop_codon:yes gene_type:complete
MRENLNRSDWNNQDDISSLLDGYDDVLSGSDKENITGLFEYNEDLSRVTRNVLFKTLQELSVLKEQFQTNRINEQSHLLIQQSVQEKLQRLYIRADIKELFELPSLNHVLTKSPKIVKGLSSLGSKLVLGLSVPVRKGANLNNLHINVNRYFEKYKKRVKLAFNSRDDRITNFVRRNYDKIVIERLTPCLIRNQSSLRGLAVGLVERPEDINPSVVSVLNMKI